MENQFQIFQHEEFGKIRTLIIDGEIYFVGKDVAVALGYSNARDALEKHVDEEDKKAGVAIRDVSSNGVIQNRPMTVINESGLYSLILSSKLPKAKEFKRWVTSEVLPSIRKTGSYSLPKVKKPVAVENPVETKLIITIALKDVKSAVELVEELFGVKPGIALATCINVAEKHYSIDFSEVKELFPPAEHNIGYMNATQVGKFIAEEKNIEKLSGQKVNQVLLESGLQEKDGNGYKLTAKGKAYGEAIPFNNNKSGHSGYQIKWSAAVSKFF